MPKGQETVSKLENGAPISQKVLQKVDNVQNSKNTNEVKGERSTNTFSKKNYSKMEFSQPTMQRTSSAGRALALAVIQRKEASNCEPEN